MFRNIKENAKFNLQGRILKSFSVIFSSFLSFGIFVLSSVSCMYLLVIDTEFSESIGVFDSQYIIAAACAFAVLYYC